MASSANHSQDRQRRRLALLEAMEITRWGRRDRQSPQTTQKADEINIWRDSSLAADNSIESAQSVPVTQSDAKLTRSSTSATDLLAHLAKPIAQLRQEKQPASEQITPPQPRDQNLEQGRSPAFQALPSDVVHWNLDIQSWCHADWVLFANLAEASPAARQLWQTMGAALKAQSGPSVKWPLRTAKGNLSKRNNLKALEQLLAGLQMRIEAEWSAKRFGMLGGLPPPVMPLQWEHLPDLKEMVDQSSQKRLVWQWIQGKLDA